MIFALLFLLITKHLVADFILQSDYQVRQKGKYGASGGIEHAGTHGIFTTLVLFLFFEHAAPAVVFGLLDSVIHYHIDYVKARFGTKDANTQKFWRQLGIDQWCHYCFYIWLVWLLHDII